MANEIVKVQSTFRSVAPASAPSQAAGQNDLSVISTGAQGEVAVAQAKAVAETLAPYELAKRFPRDEMKAADEILMACQRPKLANAAIYEVPRQGGTISGPSIRLAEAIAAKWGNITSGFRVLQSDQLQSSCVAYAIDLQTNVRVERSFVVSHMRHTKGKGDYLITDPRMIYEAIASQASRYRRNCILELIPSDVTEDAMDQCRETQNATTDTSPASIRKLLAAFEKFGVSKAMIEKRIQRHIDTITPAQYISLTKIGNALKNGETTVGECFDLNIVDTNAAPPEPAAEPSKKKSGLAAVAAKAAAKAKEPEPPAEPPAPETRTPPPDLPYTPEDEIEDIPDTL